MFQDPLWLERNVICSFKEMVPESNPFSLLFCFPYLPITFLFLWPFHFQEAVHIYNWDRQAGAPWLYYMASFWGIEENGMSAPILSNLIGQGIDLAFVMNTLNCLFSIFKKLVWLHLYEELIYSFSSFFLIISLIKLLIFLKLPWHRNKKMTFLNFFSPWG